MMLALDNCSSDHTIAIESEFSEDFDSHLIAVQTRDDRYHTQAIRIHNRPHSSMSVSSLAE